MLSSALSSFSITSSDDLIDDKAHIYYLYNLTAVYKICSHGTDLYVFKEPLIPSRSVVSKTSITCFTLHSYIANII